ncbi:MAG: helicase C-terminal domain-containing protein [Anaerolineae bacterium]|nr:exonuclease domain-containing protein [Thermoflexales bacterium]MDW8406461.1 helicase C-terminal domain-containing protein [Anaerolineae bacterium]
MRILASLDLETTGLDPERDAIIEIGIVRFRGSEVLEEWSSLVNPRRPIPQKITELTGITQHMVEAEGVSLWDALRTAQRIVGQAPIIGHNIAFDLSFLRKQDQFLSNPSIDTFDLAGILVPHAGRYGLGALGKELGIESPATHRALDDARVAHRLYMKMFERAIELPKDTLEEIVAFAERSGWTLVEFWRDALEQHARGVFTTTIGAQLKRTKSGQTVLARKAALKAQLAAKPLEPREEIRPLDIEYVAATLNEGGAFARSFQGYEMRPQQIDMLKLVTTAFNESGHALIEAGTGTGKSVAYLIPAMLWAVQNGERVVVSTNTINLQEQLFEKDVPAVIRALGLEARVAVMKGRARYLCPLRLQELRRNGPKTLDEARLLAKILIWLPNTLTGDGDELFMPAAGERAAFNNLSAQNPACNFNMCSAADCYFHQARRLAESAHVVIINHALLLADIAVENRALPEYRYLIIDEAHHLEMAATDSLSFSIDRLEMIRQLEDLHKPSGRRPTGLLADIATQAKHSLPANQSGLLIHLTDSAAQTVTHATVQLDLFFDEFVAFLSDEVKDDASEYARRIRITRALRNRPGWTRVELAFDALQRELNALLRSLDNLFRSVNELDAAGQGDLDVLLARIKDAMRYFTEAIENMTGMISKPNDQMIYWAEMEAERAGRFRAASPRLTLHTAPLRIGPLLRKHVWEAKKAVVLTSATLRTATPATKNRPTFDYIQERLNAADATTLAVGSPFDYTASTLMYIVTDIPEPNQTDYQRILDRALVELFRASQGRGLALFTSYSQLRATARAITPILMQDGILVYDQSDGVSRRVLLEQFRAADKAVLLGTRSFWEGVDIQGEKLSAVAICKLPFDVPNDPIFEARGEMFSDPFNEYSVPETVLRFRQGFGRLIRSKTDRGVVVVLDKRVITKGYGPAFLNSLPDPTIQRGPVSELGRAVRHWLSKTPDKVSDN